MKKRILSILLCLCMAITLLPTAALAAEDKTDRTSRLALYDTPAENLTEGWKWEYNADTTTYTLTLDNVNFNVSDHSAITFTAKANQAAPNINIVLIGKNVVKSTNSTSSSYNGCGLYLNAADATTVPAYTFTGDGSLEVSGQYAGIYAYSKGNVTVDGTTIAAEGAAHSGILTGTGTVSLKDSTVTAKVGGSNNDCGIGAVTGDLVIEKSQVSCYINDGASGKPALYGQNISITESSTIHIDGGGNSYACGLYSTGGTVTLENSAVEIKNVDTAMSSNSPSTSYSLSSVTGFITASTYIFPNRVTPTITDTSLWTQSGGNAVVYGDIALPTGVTEIAGTLSVPADAKLTIAANQTLTVKSGAYTDINKGEIINNGELTFDKKVTSTGTITNSGTLKLPQGMTNNGTLNNSGVLSADATISGVGTLTGTGKTDAIVQTNAGKTYTSTVYGTVSTTGISVGVSSGLTYTLTIPVGAILTIPEGKTLSASAVPTAAELSAFLTVEGTLINNGAIILPADTTAAQIASLNLSGSGAIYAGEKLYQDGVLYAKGADVSSTGLDLTVNAPAEATCYTATNNGYILVQPKGDAWELTLHDAWISLSDEAEGSALKLPAAAVTLRLENSDEGGWNGLYASDAPTSLALTQAPGGTLTVDGSGRLVVQKDDGTALSTDALVLTGSAKLLVYGKLDTAGSASVTENASLEAYNIRCGETFLADTTGDVRCGGPLYTHTFTGTKLGAGSSLLVAEDDGDAEANMAYAIYGDYEFGSTELESLELWPAPTLTVEDMPGRDGLTVAAGGTMTIYLGAVLEVRDNENIDGVPQITNNGTLVNNGTIQLPATYAADIPAAVKALKLTGSGVVKAGTDTYTNDGAALTAVVDGDLNLKEGDHSDKTLDDDGYIWDAQNHALTMRNLLVIGDILLPNEECTVTILGAANIQRRSLQEGGGQLTGDTLTITGGALSGSIYADGSVTLDGVTMNGSIGNYDEENRSVLTLKNTTLTTGYLRWTSTGGIALQSAILTVSDYLWAEKITMDDGSVIHMNTDLNNKNKVADGMSGLAQYLPEGYEVGIYTNPENAERKHNTILDKATGQFAFNITLKKQPADPVVTPPSDNGGSSAGGSTANGGTVTVPGSDGAVSDSAISSAVTNVGKGGAIQITVSNSNAATLSGAALNRAAENGSSLHFTVKGGGKVTLSPELVKGLGLKVGDKVGVSVTPAAGLTPEVPIFEVNLTVNGKQIHDLPGAFIISFPAPSGWNGKMAVLEHKHSNGTKSYSAISVKDSVVFATVTDLSTFTLRLASDMPAAALTDVAPEAYYYGAVQWAVKNGVTGGKTASAFAPNDGCTRAQAVTFLWRAMGSPEPTKAANPFTDVSADAYYYKAILWAVEKGITGGTTATTFAPDGACSRAQVVTFLWRAMGSPAVNYAMDFGDVPVSSYFAEAVRWAVSEGVTSGTGGKTYQPNAACTRAQTITFLYRALSE